MMWIVLLGMAGASLAWRYGGRLLWDATVHRSHMEATSGRPYRVITRADHDATQPAPVVVALHAYATPADVQLRGLWLQALVARWRDAVLVVPEGLRDEADRPFWNASAACCGEGLARPDDLGYLRGVLADVRRRYAVDDRHVVAVGVSNGGFMAYRWACEADSELTSVVSISGAGPGPQDPPCEPARPMRVLHVHGDADAVVRYEGGRMRSALHPSARASLEPFLRAGAGAEPTRSETTWWRCLTAVREDEWELGGGHVALWTVEGGEHQLGVRACIPDMLDFALRP